MPGGQRKTRTRTRSRKRRKGKVLKYHVPKEGSSQAQAFEEEGCLWYAIKRCNERSHHSDILNHFEEHPTHLNARDDAGATPLHLVCLFRNTELAKQLIKKFPDAAKALYVKTDRSNKYTGENCLHIAIVNKDIELINVLLDGESDRDEPLVDNEATGDFFLPKDFVEKKDDNSWLQFMKNYFQCEYEIMGNNLRNAVTCYAGGFPLSFAVMMNNEEIVTLLVEKGNADISKKDKVNGNTAMHIALLYGLTDMFTLLGKLWQKQRGETGGEYYLLENNQGQNALTYAASLGKPILFNFVWDSMKVVKWQYGRIHCDWYPLHSVDAISRVPPFKKGCLEIIYEKEHHQMLKVIPLQILVHQQFNTYSIRTSFYFNKYNSLGFLILVFLCSANIGLPTHVAIICELILFVYSLIKVLYEIFYGLYFDVNKYNTFSGNNQTQWAYKQIKLVCKQIKLVYKWTHAVSIACCLFIGFIPFFAGCWSLKNEDCEVHSNVLAYILDAPNTIWHITNGKGSYFHFKDKTIMVYRKCTLAVLNISAWLNFLWYFVVSRKQYATFYLAMMRTDIDFLAKISAFFIVSFSTVFSALRLDATRDPQVPPDDTFLAHTTATIGAMLGDYSKDDYTTVEAVPKWIPQLVSFVFMYAFSTIIINMFIGIMGDTYNRVSKDIDAYWNWEMLGYILDNSIFKTKYCEWKIKNIYWVSTKLTEQKIKEGENENGSFGTECCDKDRYLEVLHR